MTDKNTTLPAAKRVQELEGAELDYWVARALGYSPEMADFVIPAHSYSTDWSLGGPIIDRETISLYWCGSDEPVQFWLANVSPGGPDSKLIKGPTPLIAAMRAFVAHKFGDTVGGEA